MVLNILKCVILVGDVVHVHIWMLLIISFEEQCGANGGAIIIDWLIVLECESCVKIQKSIRLLQDLH